MQIKSCDGTPVSTQLFLLNERQFFKATDTLKRLKALGAGSSACSLWQFWISWSQSYSWSKTANMAAKYFFHPPPRLQQTPPGRDYSLGDKVGQTPMSQMFVPQNLLYSYLIFNMSSETEANCTISVTVPSLSLNWTKQRHLFTQQWTLCRRNPIRACLLYCTLMSAGERGLCCKETRTVRTDWL